MFPQSSGQWSGDTETSVGGGSAPGRSLRILAPGLTCGDLRSSSYLKESVLVLLSDDKYRSVRGLAVWGAGGSKG